MLFTPITSPYFELLGHYPLEIGALLSLFRVKGGIRAWKSSEKGVEKEQEALMTVSIDGAEFGAVLVELKLGGELVSRGRGWEETDESVGEGESELELVCNEFRPVFFGFGESHKIQVVRGVLGGVKEVPRDQGLEILELPDVDKMKHWGQNVFL